MTQPPIGPYAGQGQPPYQPGPQQAGGPRRVAPPPPLYAAAPPVVHQPRDRSLGELPDPGKKPKGPLLAWLIGGVASIAVVALVIALFVSLGSSSDPVADPGSTDGTSSGGGGEPVTTSTYATANPVQPSPGLVPIDVDAQFESITFVAPTEDAVWTQNPPETRQPDMISFRHAADETYFSVLQQSMHTSPYTDEAVTRADLDSADQGFTSVPQVVGEPFPYVVEGEGGYSIELLAQRLEFFSGTEAFVISRLMPQSGTRISIVIIAAPGEFDDPTSPLRTKLDEITFTVG